MAENETAAKPVPDKVMDDMRSCGAGIVHVGSETTLLDAEAARLAADLDRFGVTPAVDQIRGQFGVIRPVRADTAANRFGFCLLHSPGER